MGLTRFEKRGISIGNDHYERRLNGRRKPPAKTEGGWCTLPCAAGRLC